MSITKEKTLTPLNTSKTELELLTEISSNNYLIENDDDCDTLLTFPNQKLICLLNLL